MNEPVSTDGPQPTEYVVARLRPHARVLFWPSLALVGICAATGYFGGRFDVEWQNYVVLGAALALIVLLWLVPVLLWLGRRYVITSRRLVVRRGLFELWELGRLYIAINGPSTVEIKMHILYRLMVFKKLNFFKLNI